MSTYAQIFDLETYTDGVLTSSPGELQSLLDQAERDIDRILSGAGNITGSIQGISVINATGGSFLLTLTWNGVAYTSPAIAWNSSGNDLLSALGAMRDASGNPIPSGVWAKPDPTYYSQPWAFGPFPGSVVVEAVNSFGSQKLNKLTANIASLTGIGKAVNIAEIVGGGLRANPYTLSAHNSWVLKQATCAQAEYRDEMGPTFFRRAQWDKVKGPEFSTTGKLPLIGPKVMSELSGSDLMQRWARAVVGTARGRQLVYTPVGGTPIPDDWRAI